MKKSLLLLLISLSFIFMNCSEKEPLSMPRARDAQEAPVIDSAIMKSVPIVEVDLNIFNRKKGETEDMVGSLLEESVDYSTTTVNYFKLDEHAISGFQLSEDDAPLKVADFGPVGKLPEEMQKPSVYVMFSQPMVPLSKLGEPLKSFKGLTIDPPLEGVYRWYGTKLLSFETEKPILADSEGYSKEYKVIVGKELKSLGGKSLEKEHTFTFYPKEIAMVNLFIPTEEEGSLGRTRNVPFDLAHHPVVRFNMPVEMEYIREGLQLTVNGSPVAFTIDRPKDEKNETRIRRSIQFHIDNAVVLTNKNQIRIALKEGAQPREGTPQKTQRQEMSYTTLDPFKFRHHSTHSYAAPSSPKGNRYPVYLNFNQPIDPSQDILSLISTNLDTDLTDKINVFGSTIHLSNLPVDSGDRYSVTVSSNLKDVYGQYLSGGTRTIEVEVPEAGAYITFPNKSYGSSDYYRYGYLESQFTPGLIMQHQNIDTLLYSVKRENSIISHSSGEVMDPVDISGARRNHANYEFIDLRGKVNSAGTGSFNFKAQSQYRTRWDDDYTVRDNLLVQITDIGITTRYGYNKILVWANSLTDGSPIAGAEVRLYNNQKKHTYTNTTDESGFAVFDLEPGEFKSGYYIIRDYPRRSFWVAVETNNDLAEMQVFNSQSGYQHGVNSRRPEYSEDPINRILLFSDRKLYKPGEELSYRGIHWYQVLGDFKPAVTSYSLQLKTMGYNGKVIYSEKGKTSSTGGFYGTFTLPEDIEPGEYYLQYNGSDGRYNAIIQIAYFRRLNFAVSSSVPDRSFYDGDTISIPVKAYYLAGGAMPGADYTYFWTRKMTGFKPSGARWKPYVFGLHSYTPEKTLDSGKGVLSVSGEAQIKQEAKDHEKAGGTYRYVLETTVTDIDDQQVSSTVSTLVHPSLYYIGAKLGEATYWSRFVKAKSTSKINLALVTPEGEIYPGGSDIAVEVYKISWKSSYRQGVYDRVNVSYKRTEELLETLKGKVNKSGIGQIDITPPSSGSYILKIKGTDSQGRPVQTDLRFYAYGGGWYYWGGDADKINLVPDKDLYFVGDKAQIMVQSPLQKGRYILTLEREGIVKESIIELDEDTNMIEIPIEEGYVPRIYVALSSYTNRKEAPESYFTPDLGKPKNLFGVTALNVSNITRTVDIEVVATKDSYRPGEDAEVYIKVTRNGEPVAGAELIYLAVDRGVVDLVDYHVPNPLTYFYNPENFSLYTTGDDLRNYLMDPVSYDITTLQGGDGLKLEERKDFNPLAAFEPFLLTDINGIAKVTFKLPDTLTTYRTTAIALTGNRIGYSENEVLVKNPINVRTAFPRRLRHRDTGVGDVVLQNNTQEDQEITLSLSSQGINIPGESTKTVTVPPGSVYKVPFLLIPATFGEFEVAITVESDVLRERLIQKMIVEKPLTKEAFATTGTVDEPIAEDQEGTYAEEGILIPQAIAEGYGSYSLSLYPTRMGMLKAPINGLKNYWWYSLTEHIYHYMPDAALGKTMQTLGYSYEKSGVERTLRTMKNLQTSQGWIKYWTRQKKVDKYMDTLALMFALSAKENGIKLPQGLESGLSRALIVGYREEGYNYSTAAFSAYILNKAGQDVTFLVDNLMSKEDALGLTGYSYLTLTLKNMGRNKEASQIWRIAKNFVRLATRTVDINETYETRWYFDSEIRQISALALAGLKMDEDSEILQRYLNTLEQRFNAATWRTRTDYLWSIMALKAYTDVDQIDSINLKTKVTLNQEEVGSKAIKAYDSKLELSFPIFEEPLSNLPKGDLLPLRIERTGTGNLYYSAQIEYALPSEIALPRDEGIGVFLQYETLDGEVVNPDEIETGETYRVRTVISSNRRRSYLTLDVSIPSGMEIVDPSFTTTSSYMPEGGTDSETWTRETSYGDEYTFSEEGYGYLDHFGGFWWYWKNEPDQKIYDNHLTYSWDTFYEGKRELTFLVRATSPGIYPTPPAQASLLFEPEVFGRTGGSLFVIR